jgi:dipeptidase E
MRLFLASEGSDPRTTSKLDEYVGGLENKKILYIPTAKNGNREGRWDESKTWQFLNKCGSIPKAYQLEDYHSKLDIEPVEQADIIWITGGAAGYLMYWAIRTGFDVLLRSVLNDKIYVGSSAGSMITSKNLNICEWYIGEVEKGASNIPGLGLVDFDFYPHYDDSLFGEIKGKYKGNKLYLVKNGEELIVEDNNIKVIGEERFI